MDDQPNTFRVSYDIRELLGRMDGKLDQAIERITALEAKSGSEDAVRSYRRWVTGFGLVALVNLVVTLVLIANSGTP